MQLLHLINFLAVGALASPISIGDGASQTDLDSQSSPNELNPHTELLEKRFNPAQCRRIGTTILRIGTSTATFTFVNGGAALASKVCHDEGNERCERYAGYIRDGYNLIFALAGHNHGAAAQAHDTDAFNVEPGNTKRDDSPANADAYASLVSILDDYNFGFDSIEAVDLSNANVAKRDASEPEMVSRSIVRNFRTGNGTAADIALNLFSNGAATLDLAGDVGSLAAYGDADTSAAGSVEKRFDGAGFKIAFTTRKKSLLTKAHQNQMSTAIANQWASRADGTDMDEYFGLVKTDHNANFYYRVISELRSFGLNYESVDVCGGMASFL